MSFIKSFLVVKRMKKLKVGILGATGMVGQQFVALLDNHPWFEIVCVAASSQSAGRLYKTAVSDRWKMKTSIPSMIGNLKVKAIEEDFERICSQVDFVFSAIDMDKEKIREIEERYAACGIPVVSNNSAHRWTEDVPMIIPEVNHHHVELIHVQQKNRGWTKGFIAVKPNCSIQSYVSILAALSTYKPTQVAVTSLQAISGAGQTFETWPEMVDNAIPFISGEEEKSEREPLKIWGLIKNGKLQLAKSPQISATCIRIPVSHGHMASVSVNFRKKPSKDDILDAIRAFANPLEKFHLPSAPKKYIRYFEEENRPQTALDRDFVRGMGITMGRLREDKLFDWKFVALSHNTIRGAAGGAILLAELLLAKKFLMSRS